MLPSVQDALVAAAWPLALAQAQALLDRAARGTRKPVTAAPLCAILVDRADVQGLRLLWREQVIDMARAEQIDRHFPALFAELQGPGADDCLTMLVVSDHPAVLSHPLARPTTKGACA